LSSNTGKSFFDQSVIDEVRAAADIVDVVGEVVTLRRQGRNYLGLCPFHTEKTPSFTVSPDKQIFHCFGCGAGGDVFSFLQRREGLSFPDAMRRLAERAGLRLPEPELSPDEARRRDESERLRQVVEMASAQFQRWLWADAGREARLYLARRGFREETLRLFGVGWAPPAWDGLLAQLGRRGVDRQWLARAGLVVRSEDGSRTYDRFRGRVMFPIWDQRGRAVAFGGRVLPGTPDEERGPKYLNSPETELFVKGRGLYAWHMAKGVIRERGHAVVVEGYVDAITCHQAGFTQTVASLGTALTVQQARLLLSQADQVRVAYDADAAGQGATQRGMDILAELGADVRIVTLPEGKDPDDCIARGGPAAFAAALDAAVDYVEYRFRLAQAAAGEQHGPGSAQAAAATAAAIAPTLGSLSSPVAREAYVHRFARLLGISEGSLWGEVRRAAVRAPARGSGRMAGSAGVGSVSAGVGSVSAGGGGAGTGGSQARPGAASDAAGEHIPSSDRDNKGSSGPRLHGTPAWRRAQEQLVAMMLADPARVHAIREQVRAEEFGDEACRGIVRALYEIAASGPAVEARPAGGAGDTGRVQAGAAQSAGAAPAGAAQSAGAAQAGSAQAGAAQSAGAAQAGAQFDALRHQLVRLLEQSGQRHAASLVSRLLVETAEQGDGNPDRVCRDCIRVLQEHSLAARITEVRQEVQRLEREGRPVPARLLEEYTRLVRAAKGNQPPAS
jgi:DNA primase